MNVPKLLRTALFSLLALALTGGLMAVQAQDVIVDEDAADSPPTTFDTIEEGLEEIEDGELLVIRGGNYGESLNLSPISLTTPNLGDGDSFTLELRRDDDSQSDAVNVSQVVVGDGANQIDVTVQSDGNGFLDLDATAADDIVLNDGVFDLGASRQLQFSSTGAGIDVVRQAGSSIATSSPQYDGSDVNVRYNLGNGDVEAGLEAPTDLEGGTLRAQDAGDNDNTATFPSGRFGTFSADGIVLFDRVNVDFEGDVNVTQGVTVGDSQSLTVAGALTIEGDDNGLVADAGRATVGEAVTLGSLTFDAVTTDNTGDPGALLLGDGTLTVNGAVTYREDSGAEEVQEVRATDGNSDFTLGSVVETANVTGGSGSTVVDVVNRTNGGEIDLGGGTVRDIDQSAGSGTLEITGDVEADVSSEPVGGNGVDNGGNQATIQISDGNTLEVLNDGGTGPSNVQNVNSDNGGITGAGTINFNSTNGGSQTVITSNNDGNANVDINSLPNVSATSGPLTISGRSDGSGPTGSEVGIEIGGNLVASADVNLQTPNGEANVGGVLQVDAGTTDLTGVTDATGTTDVLLNDGTLNTNGNRLEISRDFTRATSSATYQTNGSSVTAFVGSGTDGTFDTQTLFTVNGKVEVEKTNRTLFLQEAVTINGDLEIVDLGQFLSTTLELEDNIFLEGGGTLIVDSNLDSQNGAQVVFESPAPATGGYTVAGDDTLSAALVNFADETDALNVNPDVAGVQNDQTLEFDDTVEIRNGNVNVVGTGDDFSPAGANAELVRNLDGGNNQRIIGSGSFNDEGNSYDLTYTSVATSPVSGDVTSAEITDQVDRLEVNSATEISLDQSSPALTDNNAEVNGALVVPAGNQISEAANDNTLELAGDSTTHQIGGQIEGSSSAGLTNEVTLSVTGENVTINGAAGTGADASVVENVTVDAAGATISGLQQIRGELTVDSGDLQLGLRAVNAGDQEVEQNITLSDSLALASNVEARSGDGTDDVLVNGTGRLNVQDNVLSVTGSGADFNGNEDAKYFATAPGNVTFDGSGTPTVGTAGEAIPRVVVAQGITLDENFATSAFADIDAQVSLDSGGNGFDFEFGGRAELAANVTSSNGGVFRSVGTTLAVEDPDGSGVTGVAHNVSNFEVDSEQAGSEMDTTTVVGDADGNPFTAHLAVTNTFTQTSGVFEYQTNVNIADLPSDGSVSGDEFSYTGGEFVAEGAYIILNDVFSAGASDRPTLNITNDSSSVDIPNLGIAADDQGVALDDAQDLVVSNDLVLRGAIVSNAADTSGNVVIGDGARIARPSNEDALAGFPSRTLPVPVFTSASTFDDISGSSTTIGEKPTFAGTYSLVYGNDGTNDFTSGFELDDASGTITSVTVNADDVYFESNQNRLTGNATVNGTLDLAGGQLDYGRQVVIADSATVRRSVGGIVGGQPVQALADVTNATADNDDDPPAPLQIENFYTLIYEGTATPIVASPREFRPTSNMALETNLGSAITGIDGDLDVPFDETVKTFLADNNTSGSTVEFVDSNGNPQTLTVTGDATIAAGTVGNDGTLDVDGNTLLTGGSLTTSLVAAGDVTVEPGAALGAATLAFDGTEQDLQLNGGPSLVGSLALSQTAANPVDGRVFLTGNELRVGGQIDFNAGLLVVPDSVRSDVLVELSDVTRGTFQPNGPGNSIPFDRSDVGNDSTDGSHIVGRVRVGIPAGTPSAPIFGNPRGRFAFPVGTTEEYRPAALTFRTDDPIEISTNVVTSHVSQSPEGTQGLPLDAGTDDAGNPVTIGQYPNQHWRIVSSSGLGPSQEYDLELETGTQTFVQEFSDASQLRIIRRADGDADENRYFLQAGDAQDPGEEYINNLINRNDAEFANVRSQTSIGGIDQTASLFTIGVPSDVAQNVDIAITGGGPGGLDRSFANDPGDSDAPVGVFRLTPNASGATLDSLEIKTNAAGTAGIEQMGLWTSSDASFSASDDDQLTTVSAGGGAAPDSVVFDDLDNSLDSGEEYLFVTATLNSSAAGEVSPQIIADEDLLLENGQITAVNGNDQSAFSALNLSSGASALPVELANFEADRGDGEIRLQWSTASETNNAGFRIQRKVEESGTWKTIGRRDGAGTTTEAQTYRFSDADLPFEADELTYRLRQVDLDGSSELSEPITVERTGPKTVRLLGTAPNPVRSQARVRYAVPEEAAQDGKVRLELFDVMGRKVRTYGTSGESGRHEQMMQVNDLASGVYFLRLRTSDTNKTRRLTIVR